MNLAKLKLHTINKSTLNSHLYEIFPKNILCIVVTQRGFDKSSRITIHCAEWAPKTNIRLDMFSVPFHNEYIQVLTYITDRF